MVTKSEILDIVELIYFVPALVASIFICLKHGFAREAGWFFLILLSLCRILGGAMGIAATHSQNESVYIGSLVLGNIGAGFLVAAFSALVSRIDAGSKQSKLPAQIKKYLQLLALAYIILSSVGASTGKRSLTQAAYVLLAIQFVVSLYILWCSATRRRTVQVADRVLVYVCVMVAPFVTVRLIYSLCSVFSSATSATFGIESITTIALILRGILSLAMEIVAMSLYIFAGFTVPKVQLEEHRNEERILVRDEEAKYRSVNSHSPRDTMEMHEYGSERRQ